MCAWVSEILRVVPCCMPCTMLNTLQYIAKLLFHQSPTGTVTTLWLDSDCVLTVDNCLLTERWLHVVLDVPARQTAAKYLPLRFLVPSIHSPLIRKNETYLTLLAGFKPIIPLHHCKEWVISKMADPIDENCHGKRSHWSLSLYWSKEDIKAVRTILVGISSSFWSSSVSVIGRVEYVSVLFSSTDICHYKNKQRKD